MKVLAVLCSPFNALGNRTNPNLHITPEPVQPKHPETTLGEGGDIQQ